MFLYLVAGTETSAVALSWYAKYMTNHPDVQRKLRSHLLERIPEVHDRDLTIADIDPGVVPYLEAVVQESLRLARVGSGFAREGTYLHRVRVDSNSPRRYVNPRPRHPQRHDCYRVGWLSTHRRALARRQASRWLLGSWYH